MSRFTIVPAVYLVLIRRGRILLSRRFNTGFEDGKYALIAGHVEAGETPEQALVRESREEAGIAIDGLELVHTMYRRGQQSTRIDLFFRARRWRGTPRVREPEKCDDLSWFPIDRLPKKTSPFTRQAIAGIRARGPYSEFGFTRLRPSR